ncbi:hypothetical protein [Frigidibacter mobilis]|nr:hypothetical protein [Frigidibacter mobilis]
MLNEFEDLIEQFDEAFRSRPRASYLYGRPYDDFATFQIDGARVALAYCDQPTESAGAGYSAGLVLAVSFGVNEGQPLVLARRREALCRSITGKIAARYPADLTLWSEAGGEFGPDEFDGIVRDICRVQMDPPTSDAMPDSGPDVGAEVQMPTGQPPAARLTEGRAKAKRHPSALPQAFANSQPDLPHPMVSEAARIREALYADDAQDPAAKAPLVQRLTLYSMNLTLIIVVAPVGAALLTYNALGREDMKLTARAMSLTGIAVAFSQTPLGAALAAMI